MYRLFSIYTAFMFKCSMSFYVWYLKILLSVEVLEHILCAVRTQR